MSEEQKAFAAEGATGGAAASKPEKKKKKKGRKLLRRLIWTLVILLVLGVAGWSVYSKLMAEYKITYDPYTATTGSISNSLSFTGSVQLIDSATYTASADAKVREVYVSEGDRVKEGDRLVRLSTGDTVKAGFDGTVGIVEVSRGDEVKAGDTLITVADFDHMTVSVRVGESNISQVSVGQSCRVAVSSADASFDSVIQSIDYVAYTGNNVAYYTAKVNISTSETDNVWPGMQATVTVTMDEANNVTVLKIDGLSTARDNTAFVYKESSSGEMIEVPVTVGVSNGNYVEIKDGIVPGETVYKVAAKEETPTGLAALFSNAFTNRQVNRTNRRNTNSNGSGMPDYNNMPGGSFPGGGSSQGGGSRGN